MNDERISCPSPCLWYFLPFFQRLRAFPRREINSVPHLFEKLFTFPPPLFYLSPPPFPGFLSHKGSFPVWFVEDHPVSLWFVENKGRSGKVIDWLIDQRCWKTFVSRVVLVCWRPQGLIDRLIDQRCRKTFVSRFVLVCWRPQGSIDWLIDSLLPIYAYAVLLKLDYLYNVVHNMSPLRETNSHSKISRVRFAKKKNKIKMCHCDQGMYARQCNIFGSKAIKSNSGTKKREACGLKAIKSKTASP